MLLIVLGILQLMNRIQFNNNKHVLGLCLVLVLQITLLLIFQILTKMADKNSRLFFCKRCGCNQSFRHKTQLYRHKVKCSGTSPQKKKKQYIEDNGSFKCKHCGKGYPYRASIHRHIGEKMYETSRTTRNFSMSDLWYMFQYKSYLDRHIKSHRNAVVVPSFLVEHSFRIICSVQFPVLI